MKDEIFRLLKQAYSPLGLGDEFLQARAEMLDSLGIVSADNINDIVAKQKTSLEALQRLNDSRVTSALKKAEDEAKKKAEEARLKSEEEARKKAEELARKQAEEEARKKAEELAKQGGLSEDLKKYLDALEAKRNESFRELLEAQKKESAKSIESLTSTISELKKANEKAATEKARAERAALILNKAKELGIPQSRIDEGFVIADDADESSIAAYLGNVKKNIDVNKLPENSRLSLSGDKASKEELDGLANALLGNN